jgi:dihydroorotate dehydrogenase (NAD+) catalytic subunit
LGNVRGGLSGPAIRPVAVRMCYEVAQVVKVPLIGMGGIMCAADALEFLLAGAGAVAVGTGNFVDPRLAETIAGDILAYMDKHKIKKVQDLIGAALPHKRC